MGASGKLRKQINKRNAPPPAGAIGTAAQMADPEQAGKVDPKKMKQVEDSTAMFMRLIHGTETRDSVMKMLKANPDPFKAIPDTANNLMKRVEAQVKKRRMRIPADVKVATAQYIVIDLANLGNKAQAWETQVSEDQLGPILRDTMKIYIKQGIKDKSIDPVQLQQEAEKLMSPEQKAAGMQMGGSGLPGAPTATMAAQQYADKQVGKEQTKNMQLQAQNQALKGNMQGAVQTKQDQGQAEAIQQS
jgi:hypothetical protein